MNRTIFDHVVNAINACSENTAEAFALAVLNILRIDPGSAIEDFHEDYQR